MNPRKKSFAKINFVGSFFQTARDLPGQLRRLVRPVATLALVALLTAAFLYNGSSASSRKGPKSNAAPSLSDSAQRKAVTAEARRLLKIGLNLAFILPQVAETIETFAADCTTAKTSFTLGDTICVKTNGVIANGNTNRFVNFLTPDTAIANTTATITTDPQTFLYTLPTTASVIIAGNPATTLGTWKATIADPSDSSINPAPFDVSAAPASIATYAADCSTPKTVFNYGDTICAKVTGVDTGINRRIAWVDPSNYIRENGGNLFTPVTTDPQSESFVLPSTDTTTIDTATIDNRGVWTVTVVSNTGGVQLSAPFTLQGPSPTTDLAVTTGFAIGDESTGEPITYIVNVTNQGPNDAASVELTNPTLINATFQGVVQTSGGTTFSCTGSGPVTCTAANLPAGESAVFEFTYLTGSGGSTLVNTASVTSATEELDSTDNNSIAPTVIVGGGNPGDGCQLSCPINMVVSADTEQAGQPGAIVTFATEPSGNCGAVTSTPASGSFFPVGTTTVTSQSATGGGVCSFTVTVIDSAPPTITCAADQNETAGANEIETIVTVNTPTATGNNVAVSGVRSDNRDVVADPYPVGTTTITWTATDADGRIATCKQKIIVTSPGAPTISCPADKTVNADAGSCEATGVNVGTPTTTGDDVTVQSRRSDDLALTDPYPAGTTIVTWTATDSIGRTVSCLQTVTVNNANDTTPPTITAPPNISASTVSCSVGIDELGTPTATDECSGVIITSSRSDGQLLNKPFPTGTTTITYTARDSNNNTATATQTVTVTESPAIPPIVDAPANVTLFTGPGATSCGVTVANLDATLGTATASDNCPGVTVVRSGVPAGNTFPVGNTTVTYTATDRSGNTATDTQVVTVVDNTPPVITVTGNNPMTVECHTAFTDPGATANDACDGSRTVTTTGSVNPNVVGTYTLTYTATDTKGNSAQATRTVNVVDTTPPTLTMKNVSISLWPPNHKYTTINLTQLVQSASDSCDSGVDINDVVITKVTSDELENSSGDGNTLNDIIIAANCRSAQLRSERDGGGNGRVYTFTFKVTDPSGNSTTKTAKVTVPQSQNGAGAVDSGVKYTVNSNCP
ncbi:MAG TPA: HYR domain-containing protein [Pyrinomonadaceae bacterium]|nr:HYR domain-containing protein [Pyrinomonadaceae bacterium]